MRSTPTGIETMDRDDNDDDDVHRALHSRDPGSETASWTDAGCFHHYTQPHVITAAR